jgi:hypothetical protein
LRGTQPALRAAVAARFWAAVLVFHLVTGFDCASTFAGLTVRCLADACVAIPREDGSRVALAGLAGDTSRGLSARTRAVVESCPRADLLAVRLLFCRR